MVITFYQRANSSLISLSFTVVGCKFSDKIIHSETFSKNPDSSHEIYSTEYGIYKPNCGLDSVMLSWGHDEVSFPKNFMNCTNNSFQYLYRVFKSNCCDLPPEGLAMIRYHSFYPWHQDGAYRHLMNETDEHMQVVARSSVGKEAFQSSKSLASTLDNWTDRFSFIRSLSLLTVSAARVLITNTRSGSWSSPRIKQLTERSGVSRAPITSRSLLRAVHKRRLLSCTWPFLSCTSWRLVGRRNWQRGVGR